MRFTLVLTVLALTVAASPAFAWGPISHQVFNCLGQYPNLPVAQCISTVAGGTFAVASDMPDAFGFGAFNVTNDPSWHCADLLYVHDPVFAGHMILLANSSYGQSLLQQGFDALTFSKGFVGHIMGDYVGFNPKGGILCTPESGGCSATDILYMPEWGFMSALDAAQYHAYNISRQDLPLPSATTLGPVAYSFISNATIAYNQVNPKFAAVTPEAVEQCATYWSGNMAYVYDRAAFYNTDATSLAFLQKELEWFRKDIPGTDILGWLKKQTDCAAKTIAQYLTLLLTNNQSPEQAVAQIGPFIMNLYSQGVCTNAQAKEGISMVKKLVKKL